ncbi:MAG: potassium transporter, partial [Pseudomonadota bacterium]
DESGFYMALQGLDHNSQPQQIRFDLLARQGDGMYIPCVPSILLALKLARGQITHTGAQPCMGFISLEEYLELLGEFAVEWRTVPAQELTVK